MKIFQVSLILQLSFVTVTVSSEHEGKVGKFTLAYPSKSSSAPVSRISKRQVHSSSSSGIPGSDCVTSDDCDIKKGLLCSSGKCNCSNPKEMIYDEEKNTCVVLESYSCENHGSQTPLECTKHATCTEKTDDGSHNGKVCKCSQGYLPTEQHKCHGNMGTSCDATTDPCNYLRALRCNVINETTTAGTCGCHSAAETVYEDGQCLALAGSPCVRSSPPYLLVCVINSMCKTETNAAGRATSGVCTCIRGMEARSGRCTSAGIQTHLPNNFAVFSILFFAVTSLRWYF